MWALIQQLGTGVWYNPRAAARNAAGARVTNSEMRRPSAIMCWFGLVWFGWTFDPLADVIEFRGFFKVNVMKSVIKNNKINQKYGKGDEKTRQQKETRKEMYIKGSHIQTIQ